MLNRYFNKKNYSPNNNNLDKGFKKYKSHTLSLYNFYLQYNRIPGRFDKYIETIKEQPPPPHLHHNRKLSWKT